MCQSTARAQGKPDKPILLILFTLSDSGRQLWAGAGAVCGNSPHRRPELGRMSGAPKNLPGGGKSCSPLWFRC